MKGLKWQWIICLFLVARFAQAVNDQSPMHWSGDKTLWDRRGNTVELTGHAQVHQPGESLTADKIIFNKETRILDATGNCIYIANDLIIYGSEIHFNLDTRTGTIIAGRVSSKRFTLTGERINKLGPGHFQTHKGDYSSCTDCPQAWTFTGGDVDLESEGYAYMSNVTGKIKDVPVFWLPYFIVPLKKDRQTGLLPPRLKFATEGVRVLFPFFWAINRSLDMKISLGHWGGFGPRFEWEGEYKLSNRSEGKAAFYYIRDKSFTQFIDARNTTEKRSDKITPHRFGIKLEQSHEMSIGIEEKFRFYEVSDNYYPSRFLGDVPTDGASLNSTLFFSYSRPQVSAYVAGRRTRNLLSVDPYLFDPKIVQVYPTAIVTTNDKFFFGNNLAGGISFGFTNFTRTGGDFDLDPLTAGGAPHDPVPGIDPLRRATRISITPLLYTTLRPFDYFSVIPSLEYRMFFYSFHNSVPNLNRGYLVFKADFSTQLEKIYDTQNSGVPKIKHLISPLLTFNYIPQIFESPQAHPFLSQIAYAQKNGISSYHFDSSDIVPIDTTDNYNEYFVPIGKSLSYGFNTKIIRRVGSLNVENPTYHKMFDLKVGQTLNFLEYRNPAGNRKPLSKFFSDLLFNLNTWSLSAQYNYFPYGNNSSKESRHALSLGLTYTLEKAMRQEILTFDRSLNLLYTFKQNSHEETKYLKAGVNYSLSDYILPTMSLEYTFVDPAHLLNIGFGFGFQSPSKCWKLDVLYTVSPCPQSTVDHLVYCKLFDPGLTLNLTGTGYSGLSAVTSTVIK